MWEQAEKSSQSLVNLTASCDMWLLGKLLGENWATLHREVFPWPCEMNILLRVGWLCFFSHLYIHSDLGEVASLYFGLRAKGLSFFEDPQLAFSIFGPQRVCGYHFPVNIHMPSHLYGPRITSLGPGPPDSYALQTYLLHHKVPLWLLGLCRRNSSTASLGPKRTDLRSLVFMIKFSTFRHWKEPVWPLPFCPRTNERLLQCWVQAPKAGGREAENPQAFPGHLDRQMDLDRNPKGFYFLKKKLPSS